MTVFGYMRVSTLRQAEDGLSLEVQEQQIKAYSKLNNLTVDVWLRDRGVSGSTELLKRENGLQLMEAQSGDVIIASKLDRMFRSAKNALNFLEEAKNRGISLHFIDLGGDVCNGIGQLVFTILSAVAEQERGRIRERIAEAKDRQRGENIYMGGNVAFGYRLEKGKLVKDDVQQRCISMLRKKRLAGASYRQLSQYVTNEWGMALSHNAIRVILRGKRKFGSASDACCTQSSGDFH